MRSLWYRSLLERSLGLEWYNRWSYPYGGQIHEVSLCTWPLDSGLQPGIPPGTFVSKLMVFLGDYPAGSREHLLEQRYVWKSILYRGRTVPIGWGNEELRVYAGGKAEAEKAHQTLVYYLEQFMYERRLFDTVFEEMLTKRRAFLASLSDGPSMTK